MTLLNNEYHNVEFLNNLYSVHALLLSSFLSQPFPFLLCVLMHVQVSTCVFLRDLRMCICLHTPHLTKHSCHGSIISPFNLSVSYSFTSVDTTLSSERTGSSSSCTNRSGPIMVVKYRRKDAQVRHILDLPGSNWPFVLNLKWRKLKIYLICGFKEICPC